MKRAGSNVATVAACAAVFLGLLPLHTLEFRDTITGTITDTRGRWCRTPRWKSAT